ncbi:hypothetical protein QYM36_003160 [Artemia franciscana]|uniref:Uncharacterized protein n=2 Tax=Artemia franciscana TaxID=6661 RepID=A0AA88LDX0_ARTSF|nr:hypothetical protein QYM36_003160 [Artemia franciscana]
MPQYRHPEIKGHLIAQFEVDFPEDHFGDEAKYAKLEKLLPPRPKFVMPVGDDVEEVDLHDFDPESESAAGPSGQRRAYDSDEEDEHPGGGIQCAHQ